MTSGFLRTVRYGTGALGFLSTLAPYVTKNWRLSGGVLRPMLNVSWGYLFGSHVYEVFIRPTDDSEDEDNVVDNPKEEFSYHLFEDYDKFFLLSIISNGFMLLATFGLAPHFKRLQVCAYTSLFLTMFNYFFVVPLVHAKKTNCVVFRFLPPKTVSKYLVYATLLSLTVYTTA